MWFCNNNGILKLPNLTLCRLHLYYDRSCYDFRLTENITTEYLWKRATHCSRVWLASHSGDYIVLLSIKSLHVSNYGISWISVMKASLLKTDRYILDVITTATRKSYTIKINVTRIFVCPPVLAEFGFCIICLER